MTEIIGMVAYMSWLFCCIGSLMIFFFSMLIHMNGHTCGITPLILGGSFSMFMCLTIMPILAPIFEKDRNQTK